MLFFFLLIPSGFAVSIEHMESYDLFYYDLRGLCQVRRQARDAKAKGALLKRSGKQSLNNESLGQAKAREMVKIFGRQG